MRYKATPFPWISLAISAAFTFLGALLSPKNKTKDAGLEGFQVPTATEDRPKPMWVGTVRHKSPNCIWYGDYAAKAIKNKVGALQGIMSFGSAYLNKQTIGYEYRLGFQLDLGWGEMDAITKIRMADKDAWTGSVSTGTITIDNDKLFGGLDTGGNGGFKGRIVVYNGNGTQSADSYVVATSGATPAYKHDVVLVFKGLGSGGAYVGNTAAIPDMTFDVRRCPNQLGVTGGKHVIDTHDANPVCALFELMTRSKNQFGGGYNPLQFNTGNWQAAAEILHSEGLGISRMFDTSSDVETLIQDYLQLIDGVININMTTGKFELTLARADYVVADLPVFDEDNIIEVVSFKRGAWVETYNETKLSYTDRTQEFESLPVAAQDVANASGLAEVRSQTVDIKGLTNPTNANKVNFRELRLTSSPLSTLTMRVNRNGFGLYGGAVFKFVSPRRGITQMIFRVADVDTGKIDSNSIQVTAIQDIFSLGQTAYAPPDPTTWEPPVTTPADITDELLFEQPYLFHATDNRRVATVARPANGAQLTYDLYVRESTASGYGSVKTSEIIYTPAGTLDADYTSSAYDTSGTLTVVPVYGMDDLPTPVAPGDIANGAGLMLIGSEILAYESYTVDMSGNYVFDNVWGGLLDTILATHLDGAKVWFISEGLGVDPTNYSAGATIKAKLTSRSSSGVTDITTATEMTL